MALIWSSPAASDLLLQLPQKPVIHLPSQFKNNLAYSLSFSLSLLCLGLPQCPPLIKTSKMLSVLFIFSKWLPFLGFLYCFSCLFLLWSSLLLFLAGPVPREALLVCWFEIYLQILVVFIYCSTGDWTEGPGACPGQALPPKFIPKSIFLFLWSKYLLLWMSLFVLLLCIP